MNGNILITGGLNEKDEPLPTSVIFDTHKDKMFVVGNMVHARYRHSIVINGSRAYAFGGLSSGRRILKSCESYDFDTEQWSLISTMQRERADFSAVSHEKSWNIYVFGGCLDKEFNTVIEKYDTVMNVWVTLTLALNVDFDKIKTFVSLQPSIVIFGKQTDEKVVKYKPGISSGERLLFFWENRYTENLEITSFSLTDGQVS